MFKVFLTSARLLGTVVPAVAQQSPPVGALTMVRTGWNDDFFAVTTAAPVINPAGCPSPDGYGSERSAPGYQTLYSAALTALVARRVVVVIVHNSQCTSFGRPKLIGINISAAD